MDVVLSALIGVMKNRGLGMNVKVLYEKVAVPTVMYGSESWGMKVTERQKLNVFEMKCLRSMTGVSWLDRVRNEVVRARTGVRRELAARVDTNVLRWFGHVERMENERCSDRILTCRIKSIRSPAKVGLVVTDLITSPVVSWEGWETPPPPPQHRGSAVILCSTTGVVRPLCSCGDLLLSSARHCFRLVDV